MYHSIVAVGLTCSVSAYFQPRFRIMIKSFFIYDIALVVDEVYIVPVMFSAIVIVRVCVLIWRVHYLYYIMISLAALYVVL